MLRRKGFTLIELMIVVAILGVLAAIALPTMNVFVRRSKSAEAYEQVRSIFNQAATYYARERSDSGVAASHLVHCSVGSADNGVSPGAGKRAGSFAAAPFQALGMGNTVTQVYYRYELDNQDSASGRCSTPSSTNPIYFIRARGDLDGDGVSSLFELATGSTSDNELFHARAFYVDNETE